MVYIEDILKEGIQRGASDIHLVEGQQPLLRINKELKRIESMGAVDSDDIWSYYRYFIKENEELNEVFRRENKLDIGYVFYNTNLRVNVSNSMNSIIFTIRIIPKTLPGYDSLHLPPVLRQLADYPQGLILVTGKSNAGKSTTLNALIDDINHRACRKILTLESPIEYIHTSDHSLIVQKEIGVGKDFPTFSSGIHNALREDCDVLIVGEIRDKATMDAAIEMAESGHLVFGTMHTRSCSETVDRIINFYHQEEQASIKNIISVILLAVISQRLILGNNGRLELIPEVMIVDDVISALIRKNSFSRTEIEDAIQTKMDKGSIGIIYSLAKAIKENRITIDQAEKQLPIEKRELLYKVMRQAML